LNSEQAELFQSCLLLILLNIDVETGLWGDIKHYTPI
jgi:hypothetical protein